MTSATIIQQTRAWVKNTIIDHNICPFAKREYALGSIRYEVISSDKTENCLTTLIMECLHLNTHIDCETTLLILAQGFEDFENFLDLLGIAEALMCDQGYEGIYQLASFHPDYCFEGAPMDDAANYTNRSPYPMLHIIRESSIEKALNAYPNPEQIPERNCQYVRQLGSATFRQLLADCFKVGR